MTSNVAISSKVHPMSTNSNGRSLSPAPVIQAPPTLSFTTSVLQKLGSIFKTDEQKNNSVTTSPIFTRKNIRKGPGKTPNYMKKTRESRRFSAGSLLAETGDNGESRPFLLIHPQSPYRVFWDLMTMVLLIYVAIFTPIRIGYEEDAEGSMKDFELFVDILFCVDVVLNFRTSYIKDNGMEEQNWWKVAKNYLGGFFFIDFVSSVPFDRILENQEGLENLQASKTLKAGRILKVSRVLKIAKLLRLFRMKKVVERMEDYITIGRNTGKMLRLLVITLVMAHVNACGWSFMSRITDQFYEASWQRSYMDGYLLDESEVSKEYLVSLMWTVMTMTTVGYGDVVPSNDAERVYEIYMMILSCAFYGFILGSMATLVASLDAHSKQYHEQMDQIMAYMKLRNFPKPLARRVRNYYKHYYERKTALNERHILDELSSSLRSEVSKFLIDTLFVHVTIFYNVPMDFQARMFSELRPQQVQALETMHHVGDIGREMYVVVKGTLVMSDVNRTTVFERYDDSGFFGDIYAFSMATYWDVEIMARTHAEVYSLTCEAVDDIFRTNTAQLEEIREKILERYEGQLHDLEDLGSSDMEEKKKNKKKTPLSIRSSIGSAFMRRLSSVGLLSDDSFRGNSSSSQKKQAEKTKEEIRKIAHAKRLKRMKRIVKGLWRLFSSTGEDDASDCGSSTCSSNLTNLTYDSKNSKGEPPTGNKKHQRKDSFQRNQQQPSIFDERTQQHQRISFWSTVAKEVTTGSRRPSNINHIRRNSMSKRLQRLLEKKRVRRQSTSRHVKRMSKSPDNKTSSKNMKSIVKKSIDKKNSRSSSFTAAEHRRSWTQKPKKPQADDEESEMISPFSPTALERKRSMSHPIVRGTPLEREDRKIVLQEEGGNAAIGDIVGGFVNKLEESLNERIQELENRILIRVQSQVSGNQSNQSQHKALNSSNSGVIGFLGDDDYDDDDGLAQSVSFNIDRREYQQQRQQQGEQSKQGDLPPAL